MTTKDAAKARATLRKRVTASRKCAMSMLRRGDRDFAVLQAFVDEYKAHLSAMDALAEAARTA